MRNIVNISLPSTLNQEVEREVKRLNFASKSEFFRYLLREWKGAILAKELEKEELEVRSGKAKVLKSVDDFWSK
jgi:Arc/MetJ-type ribon-helix-helix transcriptional regulator